MDRTSSPPRPLGDAERAERRARAAALAPEYRTEFVGPWSTPTAGSERTIGSS